MERAQFVTVQEDPALLLKSNSKALALAVVMVDTAVARMRKVIPVIILPLPITKPHCM
jgi:hypothetical protein